VITRPELLLPMQDGRVRTGRIVSILDVRVIERNDERRKQGRVRIVLKTQIGKI